MKTDVILTVSLYVVMAILCLIGLFMRHSAKDVFTKKLLMYSVGAIAIAAALGATFARSESLVTVFYWLEGLALMLGIAHVLISRKLFPFQATGGFWSELLFTGAILFLIAGAFTGLFQGLQRSDRFLPALASGLLPFLLPLLFLYAYMAWLAIPPRIYRKWFYPIDRAVPLIELNDTVRLNFRVAKAPDVTELATYTVKAPIDRTLHDLFHYMIYSHNAEENPEQPILYYEQNHEGSLLGWVFYKESFGGLSKQFLDPALTLTRNGIKANDVIIARSFVSTE
ncbi:TssN family type VI secretion system protein [Spirosoma aureum]|uniref:TssN family type VI secretion system protein n=1 Tax=Spirosoma aureum TaxID=2692134 RepID=A0A6G9AL02_9BACT|nr:TssN family type VI secretion system protein [Spirosoma aureum]QIP13090.1 TssN family type VI secretion system protein [Spirosoma aureum]